MPERPKQHVGLNLGAAQEIDNVEALRGGPRRRHSTFTTFVTSHEAESLFAS
jgi:hypothetical protein